jgi:hypothetical protein
VNLNVLTGCAVLVPVSGGLTIEIAVTSGGRAAWRRRLDRVTPG